MALGLLATGCGSAPEARPSAESGQPTATASESRTTEEGVLLDVTRRPAASLAVVLLLAPTPPGERAAVRLRLQKRARALAAAMDAAGASLTLESVLGAPALRLEVPDAALGDLLPTLAAGLSSEPAPQEEASTLPALPGDTLDALIAGDSGPSGRPIRPTIVLVRGDSPLGPKPLDEALHPLIEAWANLARPVAAEVPLTANAGRGVSVKVLRAGEGLAHLAIAYPLPPETALSVAERLAASLTGGPESRLSRSLRSAGLESARPTAELRPGPAGVSLVLKIEAPADEVDAVWRTAIRAMKALAGSPITAGESARSRAFLADRAAFERGSARACAHRRATGLLVQGSPLATEEARDASLDAALPLEIERLSRALAGVLPRGLIVAPESEAAAGPRSVDLGLWAEALADWARAEEPAAVGATEHRPGVFAVSDGLNMIVHARPGDTLIAFELRAAGGAQVEPPELPGVGALLASVAERSTDDAAFPVTARFERGQMAFSVTAPAERWPEALELLIRRATSLPTSPDEVESGRAAVNAVRLVRQQTPAALARALVEQGTHDPALARDLLGTPAGLADRTGVEIRNFLESRIFGRGLTLVAVGPVPAAVLVPAARDALAALSPAGRGQALESSPRAAVAGPMRLERRVDGSTACVAVGYPLPPLTGRQAVTADLLASLIPPASVIHGGGRSTLVIERCSEGPQAGGEPLAEVARAVIKVALSGAVPGELARARARLVARQAHVSESPAALAAWLGEQWDARTPFTGPDATEHWRGAVMSIDTHQIQALARGLPGLDQVVVGMAGPSAPSSADASMAPGFEISPRPGQE